MGREHVIVAGKEKRMKQKDGKKMTRKMIEGLGKLHFKKRGGKGNQ